MEKQKIYGPFLLFFTVFFIGFFSVNGAWGEQARMQGHPLFVEAGRLESPLPLDVLIEVFLAASGVEEKNIPRWSLEYKELLSKVPRMPADSYKKGKQLLAWMHRKYLTTYDESQTRMDVLLEEGTYNSVSSAILYHLLLRQAGIEGQNRLSYSHVFTSISTSKGWVDVETTIPQGFDPAKNKAAVQALFKKTGYNYTSSGNNQESIPVTEKELLALIFQDRGTLLQNQGRWGEALGVSWDAWALGQTPLFYDYLMGGVKSWVALLSDRRDYTGALRFLDEVSGILQEKEELREPADVMLSNAVTQALQEDELLSAREMLNNPAFTKLVSPSLVDSLYVDIQERELSFTIKTESFDTAAAALARARDSGVLDSEKWEGLLLFLWTQEAHRLFREDGPVGALQFVQQAPPDFAPFLDSIHRHFENNTMMFYHNLFVSHFRASQWDKALATLEEGLSYIPESAQLLGNKEKLLKLMP